MSKEWASDDTENYEEDLKELFCNDCKKKLGWHLPDSNEAFAVCNSCYCVNGDENRDLKARKEREKRDQAYNLAASEQESNANAVRLTALLFRLRPTE